MLYCADIEESRKYYELLGVSFAREKHGNGPEHFAGELEGIVLELYPGGGDEAGSRRTRIGFQIENPTNVMDKLRAAGYETKERDGFYITEDPDGRSVHLTE